MAGFDSANVDPVDDMVIKHAGHSSICMNLADGVGTLGWVFECIGFEGKCHHLVSDTTVVVFTTTILCKIVLIDECLALVLEMLWIDNDWNGQEHVTPKH